MVMNAEQLRAAGDWVVHLRTLLQLNVENTRVVGARPNSKHRSTRKAVKLLLQDLPAGDPGAQLDPKKDDIRKVVFNAVDRLVDDKLDRTKTGKDRLQALDKFQRTLEAEFAGYANKPGGPHGDWKLLIHEALRALRQEEHVRIVKDVNAPAQAKEDSRREMLATEEGRLAVMNDPALARTVLSAVDIGFFNQGGTGARVIQKLWQAGNYDEICELIKRGADTSLPARVDAVKPGKDRQNGDYSGFVQPLEHVIATRLRDVAVLDADECTFKAAHVARLAAEACPHADEHRAGRKVPACADSDTHQHDIADTGCPQAKDHERVLAKPGGNALTNERREQARGARKIFAELGPKAISITSWAEVQDSDMIAAFEKNPGTIWGFEDIRYPYVQAAHETADGAQPLRMMELWEAVEQVLYMNEYEELLADPDKAIAEVVKEGRDKVAKGIAKGEAKYVAIADRKDAFLKEFEDAAEGFLREMVQQMPKGGFGVGKALNDKGRRRQDVGSLAEIAGMDSSKLMAGMACKAGLWWAKAEGKPVYYCLDGINMNDVTRYKEVKNKAIEDFINNGGTEKKAQKQSEVITMVEVREILKHWDELEGTIVFVEKGKVLTPDEAARRVKGGTDDGGKKIKGWLEEMNEGDARAGRTPAPPRQNFVHDLAAIDPGLMARLPQGMEGDMDARDIVKKANYLMRVARTRPEIVLKYIMSRCAVLVTYGLLHQSLIGAAAALHKAEAEKESTIQIRQRGRLLAAEIDKCADRFKAPLKGSLLRHPALS